MLFIVSTWRFGRLDLPVEVYDPDVGRQRRLAAIILVADFALKTKQKFCFKFKENFAQFDDGRGIKKTTF